MDHVGTRRAHLRTSLALVIALALALSACAGEVAAPTASPERIAVSLGDTLRIEPAAFTVRRGLPVTFVVTNTGKSPHEFVIGDEAAQAQHEAEMAADGGAMMHRHANAVMVEAGATEELTYRFELVGETYAGCHYPGHYAAGMRAVITVVE